MTNFRITAVGAMLLSCALSAFAGPDWPTLEHARKVMSESEQQRQGGHVPAPAVDCDRQTPRLLPDHGPRAQTTPYLNQARRARFEAEMQACRNAPGKGLDNK